MIYVYAICDRPDRPLPGQLGLRDAGLAEIVCHDIAAVVSPFAGAALSQTTDELWRHEDVVESLMSDRAVLPVRFATLLPSRWHVGDILCRSYRALVEDIERVRGHVEIGMRFLSADDGAYDDRAPDQPRPAASAAARPPATGPGSAYLRARLARERALQMRRQARLGAVRAVYEQLACCAQASRLDGEADDRHGISAAFLLPRDRIASFQRLVGEVAGANPHLALLCTGPWPPYSFVTAGEHATDWSGQRHAN